jgi:CheY-like chemotaxis protein
MKSRKKILLVEDNLYDVELILKALNELYLDCTVDITVDGAEALDYLYRNNSYVNREDRNPIAIFLDIKLPKMDGKQVLEMIKADKKLKSIPIIILTTSKEVKDMNECYNLGANSYVVKPEVLSNFIESVKNTGLFWANINQPPPSSFHSIGS